MFYGANTDHLRQHADAVAVGAARLRECADGFALRAQQVTWTGSDAEDFRTRTAARHDEALALAAMLDQLVAELGGHADEQDTASSPAGAGAEEEGDGEDGLSDEERAELQERLGTAADPNLWERFTREDRAAARELDARLRELSPEELNDFLRNADPEELRLFADILRADSRDGFLWTNDGDWDYIDTWSYLLRTADADLHDKIHEAFPESQPDPTSWVNDQERDEPREVKHDWERPGHDHLFPGEAMQQRILENMSEQREGLPSEHGREFEPWMAMAQGGYGDCWMLADLQAIVQQDPTWPERHVRLNPENGTVDVTLYNPDGEPVVVTVTDDLPVSENGATHQGATAAPSARGRFGDEDAAALWPAYVEKAMAAVYQDDGAGLDAGSYETIVGDGHQGVPYFLPHGEVTEVSGNDKMAEMLQNSGGEEPITVSSHPTDSAEADAAADKNPAYVSSHRFVYSESYTINGEKHYEFVNPWGPHAEPLVIAESELDMYFRRASRFEGQ